MTDLDLLKLATYMLLENGDADATGTTLITTQFSIAQMLEALNQRQRRFLKDTGLLQTQASIGGVANQSRYTLAQTAIDVRRAAWKPFGGSPKSMERVDAWELDNMLTGWPTDSAPAPEFWHDSTLPTLTIEVAKSPSDVGSIELLLTSLPATLGGAGTALDVPDEFAHAILFGALADLLSKDGEGSDPERAAYCEQRYEMGVELARVMLRSDAGARPREAA